MHQQRAVIERIFFHDMNNITCGLINACELLIEQQPRNALVGIIQKLSNKISNEVLIQHHLKKFGISDFQPILEDISAEMVMQESRKTFEKNPLAENRNLVFQEAMGRGWGTYSMKLLGEKILRGRVNFTSSEKNGTTFQLSIPL